MSAAKINPALAGLVRPVAGLKPDPRPIREHPEAQLRALATSLQQFGQQKPIVVDADDFVLAGNGTLLAALRLGWTEIAVRLFDGPAEQARAYRIADNRTGELGEWDAEHLGELVADLEGADRAAIGFTDAQLAEVLSGGGEWSPDSVRTDGLEKAPADLALTEGEWRHLEPVLTALKTERGDPTATTAQALVWLCERYLEGAA